MQIADSMDLMLIVLFLGVGLYALYSYFTIKKSGTLQDNKLLLPGGKEAATCKEVPDFLAFMLPRLLALGVGLLALSGAVILQGMYGGDSPLVTTALTLLPLILFIWYVLQQRKAAERYW